MALIPEDRKTEGLMLPMSVRDNLSFAALGTLSRWGVVDRAAEREAVERIVRLLAVRTDGTDLPAGSLSGGNQQKVVIGKWLMMAPRILLLNDPTRGIDVGTKQEIYQLLRELADARRGDAVLLDRLRRARRLLRPRARDVSTARSSASWSAPRSPSTRLVSSALNIGADGRVDNAQLRPMMSGDWPYRLREHTRHAARLRGVRRDVRDLRRQPSRRASMRTSRNTAANKGVLLAIVAMAQTLVVLTSGIDLSVGMVMVLANCLASHIVVGSPLHVGAGRARRARRRAAVRRDQRR